MNMTYNFKYGTKKNCFRSRNKPHKIFFGEVKLAAGVLHDTLWKDISIKYVYLHTAHNQSETEYLT